MGVREYIFELITNDPVLNSLGITEASTFMSKTMDTQQIRPLCVLSWQAVPSPIVSGFPVNQRILQVWVHVAINEGDYTRVDQALRRLRDVLTGVVGVNVGAPDAWLSGINWEGESDDLRDDEQGTLMRNAQFRLTGSAI